MYTTLGTLQDGWRELLSAASAHRLLYALQIVCALTVPEVCDSFRLLCMGCGLSLGADRSMYCA